MRSTLIRLAQARGLSLQEASTQLYPPIPLFRRLLRAHRKLPWDMRSLGDGYVKSEFRRHKDVTNPLHIMGFLRHWKLYLEELPTTSLDGVQFKGKKLDQAVFSKMSEEQIGQLYELMHASKDVWKPVTENTDGKKQKSHSI